jgi:hypothetical protein
VPAEFAYHDKIGPAMVSVRQHGKPDRLRRAAKAWAGCWGGAIVAVFLPVLHFILVPRAARGWPALRHGDDAREGHRARRRRQLSGVWRTQHPQLKTGASATMAFRCESCRRALELRLPRELLN